MEQVIEFVDKARTRYENHPFYERYKDKKLDYIEVVGTFMFNQANIIPLLNFTHTISNSQKTKTLYMLALLLEKSIRKTESFKWYRRKRQVCSTCCDVCLSILHRTFTYY